MVTPPAEKNDGAKGGLVRLKPEQMRKFREIADTWGWMDMALGNRLVDFMASLDAKSQQFILGLPMDAEDEKTAAKRIAEAALRLRRAT